MERLMASSAYLWARSLAAGATGAIGIYGAATEKKVARLPYDAWLLLCIAYTVSIVFHFQAKVLEKLEEKG